jgi:hypothetical protein
MKAKLVILLALYSIALFGQSEENFFTIKPSIGYESMQFSWTDRPDEHSTMLHQRSVSEFGNISIAFPFDKGRFRHEIEVSKLSFSRDALKITENEIDTFRVYTQHSNKSLDHVALRFKYEIGFLHESGKRLKPMIAFGIQPYFYYASELPADYIEFPIAELNTGVDFLIMPHLLYKLNEKIYFDLNIPFGILDVSYYQLTDKNPEILLEDQIKRYFDLSAIKTITIKLGVGISI